MLACIVLCVHVYSGICGEFRNLRIHTVMMPWPKIAGYYSIQALFSLSSSSSLGSVGPLVVFIFPCFWGYGHTMHVLRIILRPASHPWRDALYRDGVCNMLLSSGPFRRPLTLRYRRRQPRVQCSPLGFLSFLGCSSGLCVCFPVREWGVSQVPDEAKDPLQLQCDGSWQHMTLYSWHPSPPP